MAEEQVASPQWRIYYDYGGELLTVDSIQAAPEDTRGTGIICIVQRDEEVGRSILNRWNIYYFDPVNQEWAGCDLLGLMDRLTERIPTIAVSEGRTVTTKRFREILALADKDGDFPPKSGKKQGELA